MIEHAGSCSYSALGTCSCTPRFIFSKDCTEVTKAGMALARADDTVWALPGEPPRRKPDYRSWEQRQAEALERIALALEKISNG